MKQFIDKFLLPYPTTADVEALLLASNIWWLFVFSNPIGTFSGVIYQRAIDFLGRPTLITLAIVLILIGVSAVFNRRLIPISVAFGSMLYLYLCFVSFTGSSVALNAGILLAIPIFSIYRLFSYTLHSERYANVTGTDTEEPYS